MQIRSTGCRRRETNPTPDGYATKFIPYLGPNTEPPRAAPYGPRPGAGPLRASR